MTVAGESAGESSAFSIGLMANPSGGGSVMLLAMACGGTLGISLFQNVRARS